MKLCPLVDDVVDEARSLANQLGRYGVPFEISPVMPASTTEGTYRLLQAAKPRAAMIDYYLSARPNTNSEELACKLLSRGVRTIVVTKDRNIADRNSIACHGFVIPVYWKQRLINDHAYVAEMVQTLGGDMVAEEEAHYTEKLYTLQEKLMRGNISKAEKKQLQLLLARLRLEETEEVEHIKAAQKKMQASVGSLINLVRNVTTDLNKELGVKHAVHTKSKRT